MNTRPRTASKAPPRRRCDQQHADAIEQRRARLASLVLHGNSSQRAMARQLGVSRMTVNADLHELRRRWRAEHSLDVEQALVLDLSRIDAALQVVMPKVERGSLPAVDVLRKLLERRADMIGYDAPHRVAVLTDSFTDRLQRVMWALAPADRQRLACITDPAEWRRQFEALTGLELVPDQEGSTIRRGLPPGKVELIVEPIENEGEA